MADLYCRGCGNELSAAEFRIPVARCGNGNEECDVCAAGLPPGEYEVFSYEEEEDE